MFRGLLIALCLCLTFQQANATLLKPQIAQNELSDVNDPFTDFSEFSESADEEADINFFKNGRFINFGIMFGYQLYTESMREAFGDAIPFGFFLNYFFDLRFAAQFTYLSSQSTFAANSLDNTESFSNSSDLSMFSLAIKYYLNTDNVTKGLAKFNPYLLLGFTQVTRTLSNSSILNISRDSTNGFEFGGGFEIPLFDGNMFMGGQALFHLINFQNENEQITIDDKDTGIYPSGDVVTLMFLLGKNF